MVWFALSLASSTLQSFLFAGKDDEELPPLESDQTLCNISDTTIGPHRQPKGGQPYLPVSYAVRQCVPPLPPYSC